MLLLIQIVINLKNKGDNSRCHRVVKIKMGKSKIPTVAKRKEADLNKKEEGIVR